MKTLFWGLIDIREEGLAKVGEDGDVILLAIAGPAQRSWSGVGAIV